jgi:hypothetical protein
VDDGATVGLLLRQSTDFSIRLELADARARVILRRDGRDEVGDEWPAAAAGSDVTAELSTDGVRFAANGHWSHSTATDVLSTEVAGGFVGTVWGPYVEGPAGVAALVTATEYRGGAIL